MSMLVLVAVLTTIIGLWLSQAVFYETVAKLPPLLQDPLTSRFAVDPYIWREPSFRSLRRRYAAGQALLVLSFALWAAVALAYETGIAIGLGFIAAVGAIFLIYRCLRYGM